MKIRLVRPTWYTENPTMETMELANLLNGVWRESANLFFLESEINKKKEKPGPLGIQPFINEVLNQRLLDNGWDGIDGRFSKSRTWIRITFRHQMSLGSDFLEAIRLAKAEEFEQCIILAAEEEFLRVITPRDWRSICSFPKLTAQLAQLEGYFDTPLMIGELTPNTRLSPELHGFVYGQRLRP